MTLTHETGLTRQIIGLAMRVHTRLGPGMLESAYERCLCFEFERNAIPYTRQVDTPLNYDGVVLDCGYRVDLIPVDREARVRMDALEDLLGDDVLLVSVMHANNEFGTLQPVCEVAALARRFGALFHSDAVQALPMLACGQRPLPDLVTFSAHKIGGPKGVGAIYILAGVKLKPLVVGGGQEREMRAGTENVAGIVGFGAAVGALSERSSPAPARDAFLDVLADVPGWTPSVSRAESLPGHAHGRFPGIHAEPMLIRLDRMGLAAGSGAACSSGSLEPSHVMLAAGYSGEEVREGLRFTFGPETTIEDAHRAASFVAEAAAAVSGIRS